MDDTIARLVGQLRIHAVVAQHPQCPSSSKIAITETKITMMVMVDPLRTSSELEVRQTSYQAALRKDQVLSYAKR